MSEPASTLHTPSPCQGPHRALLQKENLPHLCSIPMPGFPGAGMREGGCWAPLCRTVEWQVRGRWCEKSLYLSTWSDHWDTEEGDPQALGKYLDSWPLANNLVSQDTVVYSFLEVLIAFLPSQFILQFSISLSSRKYPLKLMGQFWTHEFAGWFFCMSLLLPFHFLPSSSLSLALLSSPLQSSLLLPFPFPCILPLQLHSGPVVASLG